MANYCGKSVLSLCLSGRCPKCGEGKLFQGLISFKNSCESCGLDLTSHDNGDGPATAVMLIAGAVFVVIAFILEVKYSPPFWVHIAIEVPLTLLVSWWCLRFFKVLILTLDVKYRDQGR